MSVRVLVAGIGNVFLSDDGFGVAVARRLGLQSLPDEVSVTDFGIRTLHLTYALLDPPELLLVIDTVQRGEPPGTIYLIEPALEALRGGPALAFGGAHDMSLETVLASLRSLGAEPPPTRIVGCEPASLAEGIGLSAEVERAIPRAMQMIWREVARHFLPAPRAEQETRS